MSRTPDPRVLEELVDAEDLDSLMSIISLDDVAEAWCRYTAKGEADPGAERDDDDPDWWAIKLLMTGELFARRDLHRAALLKLLEHAHTKWLAGCIGAGPLENFVTDDEDDLRWIEHHAQSNERLRVAVASMWVDGHVSERTLARLDAAAGQRLSRQRYGPETWPPEVREEWEAEKQLEAIAGPDWWERLDEQTPEQLAALRRFLTAVHGLKNVANRESEEDD